MEARCIYQLLEQSHFKTINSTKILRSFVSRIASCHNRSWEIESDDESDHFRRPSYGGRQNRDRDSFKDDAGGRFSRPSYGGRQNRDRGSFEDNAGGRLSKPNWSNVELQHFEKKFYTPSRKVADRSPEEVEEFRKLHNMSLIGKDVPRPIQQFSDHDFPQEILDIISENNFTNPTPIQAQGWPIALSGRDMIGIGQTGSGKTLGYVLPGLMHIQHQPRLSQDDGPIGLVIAPTRELVQQIHQVSRQASGHARIQTACLFGGASKNIQANSLYRKPSLCIATPGRLLDFLEMGVTNLRRCTYLVMDEADRMLDMGFEPQIRKIVQQIRPDRQTLMWSATWPKDVQELAGDFLQDYVQLNVGSVDLVANPDIKQMIEVCDIYDKQNRFVEKIRDEMNDDQTKVLVFAQTKSQVDLLARKLYQEGLKARPIHGDHTQANRDRTLQNFRRGTIDILVATDVASRGLDVDDISLVVNYDFPDGIDDYIHRIGRTGRAGKKGKSFSLFTERNAGMTKELIRVLKQANQEVPEELYNMMGRGGGGGGFNKRKPNRNFGNNRGYGRRDSYFK